jgi:phage tail protein X
MLMENVQNSNVYTTELNDTWDLIAFKVYGNEKYTKELFKANPELTKIVFFPSNILVVVPKISKSQIGGVPPWITE